MKKQDAMEEELLKNMVPKDNPFKVPDGYFEQFTSLMMDKLEEKPSARLMPERQDGMQRRTLLRWLGKVAACVAVIAGGLSIYLHRTEMMEQAVLPQTAQVSTAGTTFTDEYIDDAADYAMLDNADMYVCMLDD